MIAETQALEKLALKLESDQHRYGWDEPPVFARVYGEQTRPGLYGFGISEVPVPDQVLQERPFPETLREMSLLMRYGRKYATDDAPDELFDMLAEVHRQSAADNFVGYTLICEAWMNNELGEEEARKGTHRPLADIVGSKEVRTVYIADVGGRLIYAQRIRGEKPTVVVTGAGAGDDTFKASGPAREGPARLHMVHRPALPPRSGRSRGDRPDGDGGRRRRARLRCARMTARARRRR